MINNTIKTILLFGVFMVLLIGVGRLVGGRNGMLLMAFFGVFMNISMYYFSDKAAIFSSGAKPLDVKKYGAVSEIVKELTERARIPMPKLYISPNPQPNAFATGRNPANSAVVVTTGILQYLDHEELKGVLAHEISHIKNRDILISTIAAVFASIITAAANLLHWGAIFGGGRGDNENRNPLAELVVIILAPVAAMIIQLAISRAREYEADKAGAKLAGDPNGLANALERIDTVSREVRPAEVKPAFAHLYIANPLGNVMGVFQSLFSTHPPVGERVKRLREWKY